MSNIKVVSNNQSGGITGNNISLSGGNNQFNNPKNNKKWKWIKTIAAIVAFISAVVVILDYFKIYPFNN